MKMIFAILSLVVSQSALAYPTAGDTAEFKNIDGSIVTIKNMGHDDINKVWNVEVGQGGQTNVEKFADADMLTQEQMINLLGQCAQAGGTKETITVPAGYFESCKFLNNDGGSAWLADVPFGMVKVITSEVNLELISFTAAK